MTRTPDRGVIVMGHVLCALSGFIMGGVFAGFIWLVFS